MDQKVIDTFKDQILQLSAFGKYVILAQGEQAGVMRAEKILEHPVLSKDDKLVESIQTMGRDETVYIQILDTGVKHVTVKL